MAILVVAMLFLGMRPKIATGKVVIDLSNYVGDKILVLDTAHYRNELGQDFTVTNFKYYLGKIHFNYHSENSQTEFSFTKSMYFLVRADDPSSLHLQLADVPLGNYTSITFTLGVDSIDNCSGAQSGALDPVNAMFWTWNSGYIFLKLEGKSPQSKSSGNIFEYHIGGYKAPNNCIRTVTIDLKNNPLKVEEGKTSALTLKVDAAEVLKSPTTIDFSKLSSVTDFHNATTIADNYKDMFSLLKVENAK
jgi:hypothetical protein